MKYTQSTMLITLVLITLFGATLLYQSSIESDVRLIEPLAEKLITDQADDARLPQQALVVEADRPTAPRVELWQTAVEIPAEQIPIIRKDVDGAALQR